MANSKLKIDIVREYGWDRKTLYNKLKKYNLILPRGYLSAKQQKMIYECLGYPEGVNEKDYESVKLPTEEE